MSVNVKEAKQSTLLAVKDKNGDILRVISPNATKIGLDEFPATLILTGNVTLPIKSVTITNEASAKIYPKNSDVVIEVSNDTNYQPYVYLPGNPELGQIHIIKDSAGYAASINVVIKSIKNTIYVDGAASTSLTTAYGASMLLWDGEQWITINSGGGGGGEGAPTSSQYVTLSADTTLTNERVLTAGTAISVTDNGAGNTVVIGIVASGATPGTYATPSSITVNSSGQVTAITAGPGVGAGGGDPGAQYIVLAATASLSAERVFTPGTGLIGTDAGANSTYTLSINNNTVATISGSTFTGATKHNAGLSGSLTKLIDGTSYLVAGSNVTITSASNGAVTIASTAAGGSGADPGASYVVLSATASLPNERALTQGTGILVSDGGAGGNVTVGINNGVVATISGSTFSGVVTLNAGLSGSLTNLVDGTSYLIAGSNITITSASNGAVTISSTGGGSGADPGAAYVVISTTSSLPNERAIAQGTGIIITDGGANGNLTVGINNGVVATISGSTFSGPVLFSSGLSGSLTKLTDGTSYLIAGSNVTITSGTNGAITIASSGGSGTGADPGASYVVIATTASLPNERALTAGSGISITDGGAGSTITIAATGGGDSYLTTANVTRLSGSLMSKIDRLDYAQTSGSFIGRELFSHQLREYDSADIEGVIIGYGLPSGTMQPRYMRQKVAYTALRTTGSVILVSGSTTDRRSLGTGNNFNAGFGISGSENKIALFLTNSSGGGIVDWSADFIIRQAKTTSTSSAPLNDFTPNSFSGIVLWLRGDLDVYQNTGGTTAATGSGEPVLHWKDQSGNGNHYQQSSGTPTWSGSLGAANNQAAVYFPGTEIMASVVNYTMTHPFTVYIISSTLKSGASFTRVLDGVDTNWLGGHRDSSGLKMSYYASGFAGYGAYTTGEVAIQTIDQTSSTGTHYKNGVAIAGTIASPGLPSRFKIGHSSEGIQGYVCEIIVYNRTLSADENGEVLRYLGARYNITVP